MKDLDYVFVYILPFLGFLVHPKLAVFIIDTLFCAL